MRTVGIKGTFTGIYTNPDTDVTFCMFTTDDFCETIAIKIEFVKVELNPGDKVRLDFNALYFVNKKGETEAFLGCKVVGKLC